MKIKQLGEVNILFFVLFLALIAGFFYPQLQTTSIINHPLIKSNKTTATINALPIPTVRVIIKPTSTARPTYVPQIEKKAPTDNEPWGIAKKIGDHSYTIKLGSDERMGTPREIYDALNVYRHAKGVSTLNWDDTLARYAQERAEYFKSIHTTDEHKGLNDYLDNQDGFVKLAHNRIGENSYFGGPLLGVHVIEWLFASSVEHNANQLDSEWNDVGVGVTDTSINLIFGSSKM